MAMYWRKGIWVEKNEENQHFLKMKIFYQIQISHCQFVEPPKTEMYFTYFLTPDIFWL